MANNKWVYINLIALIALVAVLVIRPSCAASAHGAVLLVNAHPESNAPAVSTVEVVPSTQPAVQVDGVLVQPPPTVRVTAPVPVPVKDPWGITDILIAVAAILGVVSVVVVPAALMLIGKLGEVRGAVIKAFGKAEENAARLDRQGQRVSELEKASPPPPPPGGV